MLAHGGPLLVSGYGNVAAGISVAFGDRDISFGRLRDEARQLVNVTHFKLAVANAMLWMCPRAALTTLRASVYRWVGFDIAERVSFMSRIGVSGEGADLYQRLHIGAGSFIGTDPLFNLSDRIVIGENVSIGPFVRIYTSTHQVGGSIRRRSCDVVAKPVVIEDGAWVCVGATVLSGVTIGMGSIVAAGSVVLHDVAPNTMVAGVPASLVRQLSD